MGVADCGAGGARAFSSGCPGTRDEATGRGKILHPREARDIRDVVEPHEAEARADPRDRWQPLQGGGVMVRGRFDEAEFDVAPQSILEAAEGEIDFNTFLDCRISKTLGDPVAVGFVGDLLADLGQVVLTVGIWDMA